MAARAAFDDRSREFAVCFAAVRIKMARMVRAIHLFQMPEKKSRSFCRRHHIRRLALFGSVLRDDFRPDSDVDVLVEFAPDPVPGLIRLAGMDLELSNIPGRRGDLNTPNRIDPDFRHVVRSQARVRYAEP